MSTGLGINYMPDPNKTGNFIGRSPLDERKINAALRTSGVLSGAGVTLSASAMTYAVAEGVVQMSRGAADGAVIAYVPAKTLTVAATTGSPRIDIIYAYQNDFEQGDADNLVQYGVKQGTPASSPTAPTLNAGWQEVARFLVPANTTKSNGASKTGSTTYSIPYGGGLGRLHYNLLPMNGVGDNRPSQIYVEQNGSFFLPTDRILEFRFRTNVSVDNFGTDSARGSWTFGFMLDGAVVQESEIEYTRAFSNKEFTYLQVVPAGQHTVAIRSHAQWGNTVFFHYAPGQYCGRVFEVWDRGVAA